MTLEMNGLNGLKIGAVSYLNTKPLVYGLEDRGQNFELAFDLPSHLAERLANQEFDVALIPVIEAIANPIYSIVSDACIACRGPVWSVKLFSRVGLDSIRTLALDEGSRTSAALAKIILKQKFDVAPECSRLPIETSWETSDCDAVLVIGDRAMDSPAADSGFQFEIDLGEFWNQWTGLPFVFAVWAARPNTQLNELSTALNESRDAGLHNIQTICEASAPQYGLDIESCYKYLVDNLHFRLGAKEKHGLDKYIDFAKQQSLIDPDLKLQFYDCQTVG